MQIGWKNEFNLRYNNGILRSKKFATLPKAVQWGDDRTWNDVLEDLLDEVCIEVWDVW